MDEMEDLWPRMTEAERELAESEAWRIWPDLYDARQSGSNQDVSGSAPSGKSSTSPTGSSQA